ncbi:hypothetical protein CHUAL_000959 [Chamberlinius hualienensis]
MAPALTETEAGQSQKFALTMSPPLPGIAQISPKHTASASYLQNDKHSNNSDYSETYGQNQRQQRRQVNGRVAPQLHGCVGRLNSPALRKRPTYSGIICKVDKGQIDRKQEPSVNGKAGDSVVDEKAEGTEQHSCTMNGKTDDVDGAKSVNRDIETTNKTMGTLKTNVASGYVLNSTTDTNGNRALEDGIHTLKEELTNVQSTPIAKKESNNSENGELKTNEEPFRGDTVTTKTDLASGPGPPSSLSVRPNVPLSTNNTRQVLQNFPNTKNGINCRRLVSDKMEARQKCQMNLERKADNLIRRIFKVQANHAAQHVSRQMIEFVGIQRKNLQLPLKIDRPSLLRLKLMSSPSSSSAVDKEKLFHSDSVKSLSTSALVNLVKTACNNEVDAGVNFTTTSRQLLQQATSSTTNCVRRYNVAKTNAITVATNAVTSTIEPTDIKLDSNLCDDIEWTSGNLLTNLNHLEKAIDSDATASSSGGESCDEMDEAEERRTRFIPFHKRAAWKWAVDRAGIVSRWAWLQAQVADLEYKIRQAGEVYRQLRTMKEPLLDDKMINSCSNGEESSQVNGLVSAARSQQPNGGSGSSRTCPLRTLRKRKLIKMSVLPQLSRKAARLCNVQCTCTSYSRICNICCGRVNHVQSWNVENMDLSERMAYLDPSFHQVLSFRQDIPLTHHFEAILSGGDQARFGAKPRKKSTSQINDHARKQCRKLKKNAAATLTAKIKKKITNKRVAANRRNNAGHSRLRKSLNSKDNRQRHASESSGMSSKAGSPVPSPGGIENSSSQASGNSSVWSGDKDKKGSMFHELMKRKRSESAFDIDNIVIPYSMAASTRVERLQYKEIITPKWRLAEDVPKEPLPNPLNEDLVEDLTDEFYARLHERCEQQEKKRFMNFKLHPNINRRSRSTRSDSRADSSGANTPDPLSPHNIIEHHDFPAITPPSTPGLAGEDVHSAGGSTSRRRTTSLSKRDRTSDDFRVPTPDFLVEPVQPWDLRTFPLSDDVYETMLIEISNSEPSPVEGITENNENGSESSFKSEWNEMANEVPPTETETTAPTVSIDDPDWVPTNKIVNEEQKLPRNSIVVKLAKR